MCEVKILKRQPNHNQVKEKRNPAPRYRRIKLTMSHGWWIVCPGDSGHSTPRDPRNQRNGKARTVEHEFSPKQSIQLIICDLYSRLTGAGVTIPEQRRQRRDRPLPNQIQVIAVTMVWRSLSARATIPSVGKAKLMSQGLKNPAFGDSACRQRRCHTSVSQVADVSEIMGSKSGSFLVMPFNMTLWTHPKQ